MSRLNRLSIIDRVRRLLRWRNLLPGRHLLVRIKLWRLRLVRRFFLYDVGEGDSRSTAEHN